MKTVAVLGLATQAMAAVTPRSAQIHGGSEVTIQTTPYQVEFQKNGTFHCGGSIISAKYIVSAAHCVGSTTPSDYSILVGNATLGGGTKYEVSEVHRHPKFANAEYDISTLKLSRELKFTDSIRAIGLATSTPAVGTKCRVSGWGRQDDDTRSETLRAVEVPTISNKDCQRYADAYGRTMSNRTFCTLEAGKGPCGGDSGGPLTVGGKLSGIVSGGEVCGGDKTPTQYTDIANVDIRNWITQITGI